MADIFISYAREDRARIEPLAHALEAEGWSVWWDPRIPSNKAFREVIATELSNAGCVIVAWSNISINSLFVIDEAQEGLDRDVLFSVCLDRVRPPHGFRGMQFIDLSDWQGQRSGRVFEKLVSDVSAFLGGGIKDNPSVSPNREKDLKVVSPAPPGKVVGRGKKQLPLWRRLLPKSQGLVVVVSAITIALLALMGFYPYFSQPLVIDTKTWNAGPPQAGWCYQQDRRKSYPNSSQSFLVNCYLSRDDCQVMRNSYQGPKTPCVLMTSLGSAWSVTPGRGSEGPSKERSWFQYSQEPLGPPFPQFDK